MNCPPIMMNQEKVSIAGDVWNHIRKFLHISRFLMNLSERMKLIVSCRNRKTIIEIEVFECHLSLFLQKCSKDFQPREVEVISAPMVRSGLPQTEKAEAFPWDMGNFKVHSQHSSIQVVVAVSTINFPPRVFGPVV